MSNIIRTKVVELQYQNLKIATIKDDDVLKVEQKVESEDTRLIVNDYVVNKVVAFGDPNDNSDGVSIYSFLLKKIPVYSIRAGGEPKKAYHCYGGHTLESQIKLNCIIHEDAKSSINLLLKVLGSPNQVLIFQ